MTTLLGNDKICALNELGAEELLQWAWHTFGARAAIFTSFQNTGCVMIDMAQRIAPGLRVVTIDTLRLPRETYELMDALGDHYGIAIQRFLPDPERVEEMIRDHGEYLFFDSREKQEFCCAVRKVEPNERALNTVDVWIAGLRRDQSNARILTPKVARVDHNGRTILKICPLIDWSEEQVRAYIEKHNVPYNTLYDKGYTSIGCFICTTPTEPGEDMRAGRWRWMNQLDQAHHKECGLHVRGSGI